MPMNPEPNWSIPNPDALLDAVEPVVPDTESLLSEVVTYPVVAYPGQQEGGEEALEETIYAGLVFP
jgi:hypothetical protein